MGFFSNRSHAGALAKPDESLLERAAQAASLQAQLESTQLLARYLDEDRELLLTALERLRLGMAPLALAETLFEISFKPFGLACFYVALADWEQDQLSFLFYHEGGKVRRHPARRLSDRAGQSDHVLSEGKALYTRTNAEGQAAGALRTAAELTTGLIPNSWYGIPLGWGPRPSGMLNFQSFEPDAFSDSRRRVMDALAALMSNCMGG
jgi:transcriptional regulator with GAF, ATPase, and Fis domain